MKLSNAAVRVFAQRLWIAFTLAFLLFHERLRLLTNVRNQVEVCFDRSDLAVLYLSAFLMSLGLVGLRYGLDALRVSSRWIDRAFILVATFSLGFTASELIIEDFAILWFGPYDPFNFLQAWNRTFYATFVTDALRLFFLVFLIIALVRYVAFSTALLATMTLILSPFCFVYASGALLYLSVPYRTGVLPAPSAENGPRIFVFLFDEWDYLNTFERPGGPPLPNIKSLAAEATLYRHDQTASTFTERSIPKLWGAPGDDRNMFRSARRAGWTSQVVAGFLPYPVLYRNDADSIFRVVWPKTEDPLWQRVTHETVEAVISVTDFWTPERSARWKLRAEADNHRHRAEAVHARALRLIHDAPPRGLCLVHYPLPHAPFIEAPDLLDKGLTENERKVEGYRGNLRWVDARLGELVAALKAAGKWDDSLIVWTGDHGWRADPIKPRPLSENRHPPLFIKRPHQTVGTVVDTPFDATTLSAILAAEMEAHRTPG